MRAFLGSALDLVVDRSATEMIGSIFIALLLSLAVTALYSACRGKLKDRAILLTILALAMNLTGMIVAATYVVSMDRRPVKRPEVREEDVRDQVAEHVIHDMALRIVMQADADRNGRLSPDEAAAGANAFINEIRKNNSGVDIPALGAAIKSRIVPPTVHYGMSESLPDEPGAKPAGASR